MSNINVDVLIIGAGPSGSVAAAYLEKNGIDVLVVEKSKFPRYVIGESLLPRSMNHFEEVGFLDCLKAKKFEVKAGARFIRGNEVCNFDFSKKFTKGWNWTWQVPRADFDKTLTDELEKRGVKIWFENEVTNVVFEEQTTKVAIKSATEKFTVNTKFIIDASGYGRVLPRLLNLDTPSEIPNHSSIFTQVIDTERPQGKEGTLITFDIVKPQVWLWVIPFSNGNTSIGFVGPTEFINSYKGINKEVLLKMLALSPRYYNRFKHLNCLFEPKKIENYAKSVTKLYGKRYALVGNSSEFLDPVFSSGVAFGTESGLLAAKLAAKEIKGEKVDWEQEYTNYIKKGVSVFSTYVKEWYSTNLQTLFFHRPENPDVKEKICSVLAGYVWDETNPFVKKHDRVIKSMAHLLNMQ